MRQTKVCLFCYDICMNIAFLLTPKSDVSFLYDDNTLRQCIERRKIDPHSAVPCISREGRYITTISEGDFLWFILRTQDDGDLEEVPVQKLEDSLIRDVMHEDKNPPVLITATTEELVERGLEQNFIPVVDDWGSFIGIITRKSLLERFAKYGD